MAMQSTMFVAGLFALDYYAYASSSFTTAPWTSVSRKSRP